MEKFIPYEKLSKRKKRELNKEKRATWGEMSPVTRKAKNPKAYVRKRKPDWNMDDRFNPVFVI